ncbi:MAG: hypothetical protein JST58_11545 [Bacteroidetes bacterium]|nr:hypothetical protein [Bacteroidota bacterium]
MELQDRQIRLWLRLFISGLFLSGATAIPVVSEVSFLVKQFPANSAIGVFLASVLEGLSKTATHYPFLFYGYDWLAFAHFVLAILFMGGPLQDPVKNKWVVEFGMIVCFLVIQYALITGYFRDLPIWWRLVDCLFGLFGFIPLMICYKKITELEEIESRVYLFKNKSDLWKTEGSH